MSNQRIIYNGNDGVCIVCIPSPNALRKMTIEDIAAKDVPRNATWSVINVTDLPPNDKFRRAWVHTSGQIEVDIAKARNIHMSDIRTMRDRRLRALDHDQLEKMSKNEDLTELFTLRQTLRDLPATVQADIDNAQNTTELEAIWPTELEG